MTPENFTYWLQGFVELTNGEQPSEEQWASIQEHLQLVFTKVTGTDPVEVEPFDIDSILEQMEKMEKERTPPFNPWDPGINPHIFRDPIWGAPSSDDKFYVRDVVYC